ncbi:MAG: hypothetical protein AABO58_20205 [Acidobacteriota bacterium]
MSRRLTVLMVAAMSMVGGCETVDRGQTAATLHEQAKRKWLQNMTIVDRSVEFWKQKQAGAAPYRSDDLMRAIDFFETLTQIKGANLTFLGPLPDEQLERVSIEWKSWYVAHGRQLTYDNSRDRVVLDE